MTRFYESPTWGFVGRYRPGGENAPVNAEKQSRKIEKSVLISLTQGSNSRVAEACARKIQ